MTQLNKSPNLDEILYLRDATARAEMPAAVAEMKVALQALIEGAKQHWVDEAVALDLAEVAAGPRSRIKLDLTAPDLIIAAAQIARDAAKLPKTIMSVILRRDEGTEHFKGAAFDRAQDVATIAKALTHRLSEKGRPDDQFLEMAEDALDKLHDRNLTAFVNGDFKYEKWWG